MLSKCANPTCFARFRYLHQGRIYKVRMPLDRAGNSHHKVENFWLCDRCSQVYKMVLENGVVSTRLLRLQLLAGNPESATMETDQRQVA